MKIRLGHQVAIATIALIAVTFGGAVASATTLNSTARGWYNSTGFHDAGNSNYISGSNDTWHDYFTFDLTGVSGTISSANLVLFNPVANGSGVYTSYDVNTPAATLNASNTGATGIFNDLGSGNAYGSINYSTADNGTFVTINLNSQFLADINARSSNLFSVGGNAVGGTFLFGFSNGGSPADGKTFLDYTTSSAVAPLPAVAPLAILLLGGFGIVQALRRRKMDAIA